MSSSWSSSSSGFESLTRLLDLVPRDRLGLALAFDFGLAFGLTGVEGIGASVWR